MYKRFKELREENGLSKTELSRKIKVHVDVIESVENGYAASLEVLRKYAIFFNVTSDYILELSDDKHSYLDGNNMPRR